MKTASYSNRTEVTEIDLQDDDQCRDLGRLVASKCVVVVRQAVTEKRLFDIQNLWGQPCTILMARALLDGRMSGRHWRNIQLHLSYTSKPTEHFTQCKGLARVSFERNSKGKPTGFFTNGSLDWHCDQQSFDESQRVVGLMSLWGTANSQTSFLSTANAYAALSSEDKTMVDELITVSEWDGGTMSKDIIPSQREVLHYGIAPVPGMECPVLAQTASGVKGIKFPSHSFKKFRGMSREDSLKYRKHLWSLINKPENIYHHNWVDGEIVFMDQNITLHARPTDVKEGNTRTMSRMNSYMDILFPGKGPVDYVRHNGQKLAIEAFLKLMDQARRDEFYAANDLMSETGT